MSTKEAKNTRENRKLRQGLFSEIPTDNRGNIDAVMSDDIEEHGYTLLENGGKKTHIVEKDEVVDADVVDDTGDEAVKTGRTIASGVAICGRQTYQMKSAAALSQICKDCASKLSDELNQDDAE
jgi:hypothetical protein